MHIDFNVSVNSLPKSADFCVVGSGPAGMTVALELERYGRSVILLEAGGLHPSAESQEIYEGDVVGDDYVPLSSARLRCSGGSSGHWMGMCYQLRESVFQKKDGFEDAHWPIQKKDLDPFLERALSILGIPRPRNEVVLNEEFGIMQMFISKSRVRFGERYVEKLNMSENLTYVTHANLTGLKSNGQQIMSANVTNFAGRSGTVRAKHFVLAMGGIENSRMLLWFNHQTNGNIVDRIAPLGRYWMEHPDYSVGYALIDLKLPKHDYSDTPHLMLSFTNAIKRKLSMLECSLRVMELPSKDTKGLVKDLLCVAPKVGEWAASLAGKNIVCGAALTAWWEQEPIWSNHVRLSETKRDRFGIPLTELHWKKTDRDRATLQKALTQFSDYLMTGNHGRLRAHNWVFGKHGYPPMTAYNGVSYHHMGGTRMGDTVKSGVVDTNCRVFGKDNLYVAGSSVFPSGGEANPTLTIVQLALRLAEHLRNA
jgi:choline dehydrogenase-like flavoprotein